MTAVVEVGEEIIMEAGTVVVIHTEVTVVMVTAMEVAMVIIEIAILEDLDGEIITAVGEEIHGDQSHKAMVIVDGKQGI